MRDRSWRLPCLVALLAGCAPALAGGPVPLQPSTCELPPSLEGVSGHVLFRFVINEIGHVIFPKPLYSVARPPEKASALIDALEECMDAWRYEPARYGGQAAETKSLLAFHYFPPAPPGSPTVTLGNGKRVPASHFADLREEKLRFAASLLEGSRFREVEGEGWLLRTNAKNSELKTVVEALNRATAAFDTVFPAAPALPDSSRVIVLLFNSIDQFNQVAAFDNIIRMQYAMSGKYHPDEQIAYASTGDKPLELTAQVLVHEAVHHLVSRRLYQDGRDPPAWANEGVATFIELLKNPGKGQLDLARFDHGKKAEGGYRWTAPGENYLDTLDRYTRRGKLPGLDLFLRPDGEMNADLFYGQAWLLVHYLINADGGKYRPAFSQWLLGQVEDFEAVTGKSTAEMEKALAGYREKIRRAR